jgi:hypothetical protein
MKIPVTLKQFGRDTFNFRLYPKQHPSACYVIANVFKEASEILVVNLHKFIYALYDNIKKSTLFGDYWEVYIYNNEKHMVVSYMLSRYNFKCEADDHYYITLGHNVELEYALNKSRCSYEKYIYDNLKTAVKYSDMTIWTYNV